MEPSYKIIGGDGREYGPVGTSELSDWVRQGRVAAQTHVWTSATGKWAKAFEYPEFQKLFSTESANTPKAYSPATIAASPDSPAQPVGFWMRLGAYFIDSILLAASLSLLLAPLQKQINLGSLTNLKLDMDQLLQALVWVLVYMSAYSFGSMAYYVVLNGLMGATVGKLAIGARIVNLDGSKLTYGRAFWRYSAELVSWLCFGIGYLFIAFREDKRGLHDLIAKTKVIYIR